MSITSDVSRFDSLAVYFEGSLAGPASVSCDFNIWIPGSSRGGSYLDIGIKFAVPTGADALVVYVPFVVSERDFLDLWDSIRNPAVSQALFHVNACIDAGAFDDYFIIRSQDGLDRLHLAVYGLDDAVIITNPQSHSYANENIGSLITINLQKFRESGDDFPIDKYVRFRIPYIPMNDALKSMQSYKDAISSPFLECQVDSIFEINESRGLPAQINRRLSQGLIQITEQRVIAVFDSTWSVDALLAPYRVRALEPNVWEGYLPDSMHLNRRIFQSGRLMVWQWCTNETTMYFRARKKTVNMASLLVYLVVFLLLSLLADCISQHLI